MSDYTMEITGVDQTQLAQEIGHRLTAAQGEARVFDETERDLDPIATISVAFGRIQAAGVIVAWWQGRHQGRRMVTI